MDAGYAQILKVLVRQAFDHWIENDDNIDKWFNPDKTFTAKDCRILVCNWAGEAYKNLLGPEYDNLRRCCFGYPISADGSEDEFITREGLSNYVVPPPMSLLDLSASLPVPQPPDVPDDEDEPDQRDKLSDMANDDEHNLVELMKQLTY